MAKETISCLIIPKQEFKAKLENQIKKGQEILHIKNIAKGEYDYKLWNDYNREFLERSFNIPDNKYAHTYDIAIPEILFGNFSDYLKEKIIQLKSLIERIELIPEQDMTTIKNINTPIKKKDKPNMPINNKIFIVHGRDELLKAQVKEVILKLGLNPIILSEQANKGKTVIEKLEEYTDVRYAIVLLTPDDEGKLKKDDILQKRARQNVILELGYFIGKLGRGNIAILHNGNIEKPSDINGMVYIDADTAGAWKLQIAKELKNAKFNIDLNTLI